MGDNKDPDIATIIFGCLAILFAIYVIISFIFWIIYAIFSYALIALVTVLMISIGILIVSIIPIGLFYVFRETFNALKDNEFESARRYMLPLLTVIGGGGLGFAIVFLLAGYTHPLVITACVGSAIPLAGFLLYPPLNRQRLIKKYKSEDGQKKLIAP